MALARFLIGKIVVRDLPEGKLAGRIVETEAYIQGDAAAHSFNGMTPRNRSLFLRHGHAYVYLAYGTSWMLNVSSEAEGVGSGVLIRALEPVTGTVLMAQRRGTEKPRDLLRGPGRLAQALAIDRALDGLDLTGTSDSGSARTRRRKALRPQRSASAPASASRRMHTGPCDFFLKGSAYVSGPAALNR